MWTRCASQTCFRHGIGVSAKKKKDCGKLLIERRASAEKNCTANTYAVTKLDTVYDAGDLNSSYEKEIVLRKS